MTLKLAKPTGAKVVLKNYNTPTGIAGVAPTLDYRFSLDRREIEAVSLTDKLTFTGGTEGTFVGSDGLLQRAQSNLPRFQHSPISRQSLGLLTEATAQNIVSRSQEFNNANWLKTQTTVSENSAVAPDGSLTADKLIENSVNDFHYIQQSGGSVSGLYTGSLFIKAGERTKIKFSHGPGFARNNTLDLSTGQLTTSAGGFSFTGTVEQYPNGWWKITSTNQSAFSSNTIGLHVFLLNEVGSESYAGDGTSGVFVWGAQLETGSSATSYIPTTTSAVTRTADSATISGTGVITGTYTLVEKPAGCAVVNGGNINLVAGCTVERVMVFPAALSGDQITAIRGVM